jgi:chromate transporter
MPRSLREITLVFLRLGLTAFGGLAMVEPMRRLVVDQSRWLSQEEFLDGLALCQMVPGATVVQLSTYVGYRLRRVAGALSASGAFILPAFLLMLALSFLYFRYAGLAWVKVVSRGLNLLVLALLLQAIWRLSPAIKKHWFDLVIAALALGAFAWRINYLLVILLSGLLRLALELIFSWDHHSSSQILSASPPPAWKILTQVIASLLGISFLVWGIWQLDPRLGLLSFICLKIGVVSFGGGYIMIPILQWEVVDSLGWLNLSQFLDGILLGFITPGPIIILATFVGYRLAGMVGGLVSTVAVFLMPILIIIFLTPFYQVIKEKWWMRPFIQGILAALIGMLIIVIVQMGQTTLISLKDWALLAGTAVALVWFEINLLWLVPLVAGLSYFIF